jgi:hypothetical protein
VKSLWRISHYRRRPSVLGSAERQKKACDALEHLHGTYVALQSAAIDCRRLLPAATRGREAGECNGN